MILISAALAGLALWILLCYLRAKRRLRLALRREAVLARALRAYVAHDQRQVENWGLQDSEVAHAIVNVMDECHNQLNRNAFERVPPPGSQWRDFEPAPLLDETEPAG